MWNIEQRLRSFENRLLRIIYCPVFDNVINTWKRRKNAEIWEITKLPYITIISLYYVKSQRNRWFGHTTRIEEINEARVPIEYVPT